MLRPVADSDLGWLRGLVSQPLVGPGFRYRGVTPSPERFAADVWADVLCQFVVEGRGSGRALGWVNAFAPSVVDGHAQLGVVFDPGVHRRGWPLEGLGLFVEYLFATFGLHKLYVQVDADTATLGRVGGDLLVREARLVDRDVSGCPVGAREVFALWRHRWLAPTNRYRALLLGSTRRDSSHGVTG